MEDNTTKRTIDEGHQSTTAALLLAQKMVTGSLAVSNVTTATTTTIPNIKLITSNSNDANDECKSLQRPGSSDNQQDAITTISTTAPFSTQVKTVLTYPVAKGAREMKSMIVGSQTHTTQVLTTRVISQKLPSSTSSQQIIPVTFDVSSHTIYSPDNSISPIRGDLVYSLETNTRNVQPVKNQALISEIVHTKLQQEQQQQQQQQLITTGNVPTTLHHKLQQVSTQHSNVATTVKAVTTVATTVKAVTTVATTMSNVQRIRMKTSPNVVSQSPQTVNLPKVKTITNVVTNKSAVAQRNSLSRVHSIQQKSQVLSDQIMNQITINQINANTQKIQQGHSATENKAVVASNNLQQQKTSNVTNVQKIPSQSICNSQKVSQLNSGYHSNHKQQQQFFSNQQTTQQSLQKLQAPQKTTLTSIAKQQQQQSTASLNNIPKSCGSTIVGVHKVQTVGQAPSYQQHVQHPQQIQTSHQKSQSTQQKMQPLTTAVTATNRVQTITQNVCKSNSVPNVSKVSQNTNVLTIGKQQPQQQITSQQQQKQQQPQLQSSIQLQQQQLLQISQKQQSVVVQKSQQQQQQLQLATNTNNLQRNHSITNVHQKVITTVPNNQKTQAGMSSKMQQQQQQQQIVMRIGSGISAKGQGLQSSQPASLKTASQKLMNPIKATNSQNIVQQLAQRNNNTQSVKIIQQQQNVLLSQNSQKQSGCIKTIPPKPIQRNHAQKIGGSNIKTSLNSNVNTLKGQNMTPVVQKASIKTLLPQQTITSNIMAQKNTPIKIQQQAIQQKQLVMTPQYAQQIRQQAGQIKTLLPVVATEARKNVDNKNDTEFRMSKEEEQSASKSPVRRMPPPYECLQFVLQDHNYGAPPPPTPPPSSSSPHPKQQPINGAGSSMSTTSHPYIFCPIVNNANTEDDAASAISSEAGREIEPEGEETETAPEGEGDDEDSVTRCICDFEHDDGYMICCDRCLVWQHVDCMGIDRSNIPDEYLCERCRPRRIDRQRARALQMRKREELLNSDTSSDTSSSSADTDVGVNVSQKKRSLSQSIPRRSKSDTPVQVRRLNNNNNNNKNDNNLTKRQRRDTHPRQSSSVRKKEAVAKRGPGKRKVKRRMSLEEKEEDTQDGWSSSNMAPLRQWIESYEVAMTNHYSPELRARISSIKVNGTHSDLRQNNWSAIATGKCRLNIHSNNVKFLVATMYLPPNTPVIELRGKYMLSTQHRPQHPQGRQHAQRPGPLVFFYRLPRDGTEVCVDARTYGNEAKFVRRSCKPNAEVKHCIEKGTLHLYIVTTSSIEKNAEITIKHEHHDLLLSPNSNSPVLPLVCACNNPKECQISTASQLNRRGGSNGTLVENADGRERRRRGRRNTVSEEIDTTSTTPITTSVTPITATATSISTVTTSPRRTVTTGVVTTTSRQTSIEESFTARVPSATTVQQLPTSPSPNLSQSGSPEMKKDKKKMTREERKMEAIMKAFERLEKAQQRKQEVQARNAQRKESSGTHSDNEDNQSTMGQSKNKQTNSERPMRRKKRKGRARTNSSQSQSSRRTRLNSAESDVSSGDESNSMQSPPLLGQIHPPGRDISYSPQLHTPIKNTNSNTRASGHQQGISTAAGLLLALANSNTSSTEPPSSPPLQQSAPVKSPTCDSGASSSSQSSTPSTPLSSACLLVAAAVGPLAPGFKFPKTKKVLMNEWLKESPDPPPPPPPSLQIISQASQALQTLPSTSLLSNSINPALCSRSSDFSLPSTAADPSAEFLSQSYAAKSLATLVQAANSVSGICDSPPQQRRQQAIAIGSIANNNNGGCNVSTGSAKKRWLRQAISEECDSPSSRPESPPPFSETVAPPKKRRIARESLSSDNYTPPTTPTMLLPEAIPNSRLLSLTEDDYTEHGQSPVVEQNDERQFESGILIKEETNLDSDETQTQEKLLIDIPQSDLYIKTEEKTEALKILKISPVIREENITLKEEVPSKCEKNNIKSDYNFAALRTDSKLFVKKDLGDITSDEMSDFKADKSQIKKEAFIKKEVQEVAKGTVEIIDRHDPDAEIEEFSSSSTWYQCAIEPDAILKQRVAEMQLEFGDGIAEIVNIVNENEKSGEEKKQLEEITSDYHENAKFDDNASIDEFDVEAQMKKITGDDGNDYQEKIDTNSERDKSMDGIEGLMESSKEDSDSEDKDMDEANYCESAFELFSVDHEEPTFKESEQVDAKAESDAKEIDTSTTRPETIKPDQSSVFITSSSESIFESTSSNAIDTVEESPKIFHSIPPLSERIRKKASDQVATSKMPSLNFEAAIIESTIDIDAVDESKDGEQKLLSTALRELLEAKLDDDSAEITKNNDNNDTADVSPQQVVEATKSNSPERSSNKIEDSVSFLEARSKESFIAKEEDPKLKEIKRLKDPRTVVPNNISTPLAFKPDVLPPVKRKVRTLSITEYRKRKQQTSGGGSSTEPEPSSDTPPADKSGARSRSDSASSGTSLSSDEEGSKMSHSLDLPGLTTTLPLFNNADNEEKKGAEEGIIGWSAAPTLVERQRENLTERLKREFGLFLSDDEEERARKHGLTAEAILKARGRTSPPNSSVSNTSPSYALPQLPPQPYIPPPGSAPIHYSQFQNKAASAPYSSFVLPQSTAHGTATPQVSGVNGNKQPQQAFLISQSSQAPPGSNPYPPQFAPPTTTTVPSISKFSSATSPPPPPVPPSPPPPPPPPPATNQAYSTLEQPQKQFFNHPASRS